MLFLCYDLRGLLGNRYPVHNNCSAHVFILWAGAHPASMKHIVRGFFWNPCWWVLKSGMFDSTDVHWLGSLLVLQSTSPAPPTAFALGNPLCFLLEESSLVKALYFLPLCLTRGRACFHSSQPHLLTCRNWKNTLSACQNFFENLQISVWWSHCENIWLLETKLLVS